MFKVIYFPVKTKQMTIKGRGSDVSFYLENNCFLGNISIKTASYAFKFKGFKNLKNSHVVYPLI